MNKLKYFKTVVIVYTLIIAVRFDSDYINPLLHEFFFRRFLRYNQRLPAIVYRLIDAVLIGIFLMIPSYFKIEILVIIMYTIVTDVQQRVKSFDEISKYRGVDIFITRNLQLIKGGAVVSMLRVGTKLIDTL